MKGDEIPMVINGKNDQRKIGVVTEKREGK